MQNTQTESRQRTEGLKTTVCMYSMHGRVIVDNMYEFFSRRLERYADNNKHSMESVHHFSSRQDCRNIAEVPSFTRRTARSATPFVSDR